MKKILTAVLSLATIVCFAQSSSNDKVIELGKIYKDFMFRNDPPKSVISQTKKNTPDNLKKSSDFIIETVTFKNKLLKKEYLTLPDSQTLKTLYIIRAVNFNMREDNPIDNNVLIDSLKNKTIEKYELVDNYYSMLFTGVGNKNQPFNFSRINFTLNDYMLSDETEKGILFLKCMDLCGTSIWGYMNIVKPPNTKEAMQYINHFPKFNSQPYYQYNDFSFTDFEMKITEEKEKESYKSYYINKHYETLLYHLMCLHKEGGTEDEKNDLLLGSILKNQNYYKYSEHKETLESIFQVVKKD